MAELTRSGSIRLSQECREDSSSIQKGECQHDTKKIYIKESPRISIVVAVWIIVFLNLGINKATGVLLPSLQDQFQTYTRTIGAAVSLFLVSGSIVAVIVVQPLARLLEIRTIIITCGILSTVGMIICSVAPTPFIFVWGIFLAGFSVVGYILAVGAISTYFQKYYHVVVSIVTAGLPLAIIVFTPMTQFLIDMYGWRGAMLLLAGIQFHSVAAAVVLRPSISAESLEKPLVKQVIKTWLADIFNISLIRNTSYMVIAIVHTLSGYGYNGWLVYFISIALSKGLSFHDSTIVVLISGIGVIITRIFLAILPNDKFSRHLLYIGSATMTLAYGGIYMAASFTSLCIQSCLLGIGYGIVGGTIYVALNACVDQEDINGAVAWMTLTEGMVYMIGGAVTGWLFDLTGSYNMSLLALSFSSSLMFVVLGIQDVWQTLTPKNYTQLK